VIKTDALILPSGGDIAVVCVGRFTRNVRYVKRCTFRVFCLGTVSISNLYLDVGWSNSAIRSPTDYQVVSQVCDRIEHPGGLGSVDWTFEIPVDCRPRFPYLCGRIETVGLDTDLGCYFSVEAWETITDEVGKRQE
jgi:hypothetical protein